MTMLALAVALQAATVPIGAAPPIVPPSSILSAAPQTDAGLASGVAGHRIGARVSPNPSPSSSYHLSLDPRNTLKGEEDTFDRR